VKPNARGTLAVALVLLVAVVCIRLGFWQLGRLEERRAQNDGIRAAALLPPLELDASAAAALRGPAEALRWRRAVAVGSYLPTGEQVLRGRARDGRPGVLIATPFRTDAGTLMVLRGWAPSPDGARVARATLAPPRGAVRLEGILLPLPAEADRGLPIPDPAGDTTWRRLDREVAADRTPVAPLPVYLQLLPAAEPGAGAPPLPEPIPELSEGSHLGYALQWFSFAAIAVIGLGVMLTRRDRS
jgi:surfeit locus 1 family protein